MVGLWGSLTSLFAALADLSGPPHSPARGFLRGSSAGLSGPPRRVPLGLLPPGCLVFPSSSQYQRGTLCFAMGGPLLGMIRDFQIQGRTLGGSGCQSLGWLVFPKWSGTLRLRSGALGNAALGGALENHLGSLLRAGLIGQGCCQCGLRHSPWRYSGPRSLTRVLAAARISCPCCLAQAPCAWYLGRGNMDLDYYQRFS